MIEVIKVIQELEQDQELQQYQYFVGDDAWFTVKNRFSEEQELRPMENFAL